MASMKTTINNLPAEILVNIFSYLSLEDLALNVQCVCIRWSQLCSHDVLWKDSLFSTSNNMPDDYVISVLEKVPKLRSFHTLKHSDEILHALSRHCKSIRKLIAPNIWPVDVKTLQNLFTECTKLEELTVDDVIVLNRERGQLVAQCRNLRSLSLVASTDTPVELKVIADGCPSLQQLNTDGTWYYSDMKYFLEKKGDTLVSLRMLHADEEDLCVIPLLTTCKTGLRCLELVGDCLSCSSDTISTIRSLSTLTSLKIEVPSQVGDAMAGAFTEEGMIQLLELEIRSNTKLSTVFFDAVYNCQNLLSLVIIDVPSLSDDGLEHLYMCTKLENLELYCCVSLTDAALLHVAKCHTLKNLNITHCPLIKSGLRHLINLHDLKYLTIVYCDVSSLPLDIFPMYLKKLRKLTVSDECNINYAAIPFLDQKMPHLRLEFS